MEQTVGSNSGDIGKKDRHYPVFTVTKPYIRTIGPRKWPFPEFRLVHLAQLIQCVHGWFTLTAMACIPRRGGTTDYLGESRKGNCWDNAPSETLFASLKVERLHGQRFKTICQAKMIARSL
jgi:hypothetical protein